MRAADIQDDLSQILVTEEEIRAKLDELAHKGRPITARDGIDKLAEQRMPRYRAWADYIIDSRDCAANTAHALLDTLPPAL